MKTKKTKAPSKATAKKAPKMPPSMTPIQDALNKLLRDIQNQFGDVTLTTPERKRMMGTGVRRYGFIEKTFDVSRDHLRLGAGVFDHDRLAQLIEEIETLRNIAIAINRLATAVNDNILDAGDEAYRLALSYYGIVRELARRGDTEAIAVFQTLRFFFQSMRRGRASGAEPTKKELMRDAAALLDGRKEGEVVIASESAAPIKKGARIVKDTATRRGTRAVKAVVEEEN
jgi:hypothetical protein